MEASWCLRPTTIEIRVSKRLSIMLFTCSPTVLGVARLALSRFIDNMWKKKKKKGRKVA